LFHDHGRAAKTHETGVEPLLGDDVFANLGRLRRKTVDGDEAAGEEAKGDEEERVR
jgi:hypothetical protein